MNHWNGPSALDRDPAGRSPEQLDEAWSQGLLLRLDGEGRIESAAGRPLLRPTDGQRHAADLYLGRFEERPWFARPGQLLEESIAWREAPADQYDPLAAAVFLALWHAQAPACERCGASTQPDDGGARRACLACGALSFARMDPSVIIAITDPDDRLLLARNFQWPAGRVSIIAGFVEAGESVEQACHREAAEEVGVTLGEVTYVGSQPWPMPRSLMLGFEARAVDSQIRVDGDEILEGHYYSRADLAAAVERGEVVLPGGASIARHLIERWLSAR